MSLPLPEVFPECRVLLHMLFLWYALHGEDICYLLSLLDLIFTYFYCFSPGSLDALSPTPSTEHRPNPSGCLINL